MDAAILVQNVKSRCRARGVAPTVACRESGVGHNFIPDINKGKIPSVAKVQMMAAYLGCTVSDLLGEVPPGQKGGPTPVSGTSFTHPAILDMIEELSPQSREEVLAFIEFKRTQEGRGS